MQERKITYVERGADDRIVHTQAIDLWHGEALHVTQSFDHSVLPIDLVRDGRDDGPSRLFPQDEPLVLRVVDEIRGIALAISDLGRYDWQLQIGEIVGQVSAQRIVVQVVARFLSDDAGHAGWDLILV